MARDRLVSGCCVCKAGALLCHHCFVALVLLETACLLPVASLTAVVNDTFASVYGTGPKIEELWADLRLLAEHDFGHGLSVAELKEQYKPGTEKRKLRVQAFIPASAEDLHFLRPERKTREQRGVKARPHGKQDKPGKRHKPVRFFKLKTFDPVSTVRDFDCDKVDYQRVHEAFLRAPAVLPRARGARRYA